MHGWPSALKRRIRASIPHPHLPAVPSDAVATLAQLCSVQSSNPRITVTELHTRITAGDPCGSGTATPSGRARWQSPSSSLPARGRHTIPLLQRHNRNPEATPNRHRENSPARLPPRYFAAKKYQSAHHLAPNYLSARFGPAANRNTSHKSTYLSIHSI